VEEPREEEDKDKDGEEDEEEDEELKEDMTNLWECKESTVPERTGFRCQSGKAVTRNSGVHYL